MEEIFIFRFFGTYPVAIVIDGVGFQLVTVKWWEGICDTCSIKNVKNVGYLFSVQDVSVFNDKSAICVLSGRDLFVIPIPLSTRFKEEKSYPEPSISSEAFQKGIKSIIEKARAAP